MSKNRVIHPGFTQKFSCGDTVCREDDERHHGVVVAVIGNNARVAWIDLRKAKEDVDQDELVLVERAKNRRSARSVSGPATVVESPLRRLRKWEEENLK